MFDERRLDLSTLIVLDEHIGSDESSPPTNEGTRNPYLRRTHIGSAPTSRPPRYATWTDSSLSAP